MRWKVGPSFGRQTLKAPPAPPSPPPKLDVDVSAGPITNDIATINVPAYDLGTHNHLMEVRVYVVLVGQPVPSDADGYITSAYPFGSGDVSASQVAASYNVALPAVADGDYFVQVILGFDA